MRIIMVSVAIKNRTRDEIIAAFRESIRRKHEWHTMLMPRRENIINIVKREQKMAETVGRYNIFATLSLSLSQVLTYSSISFIYCPRGRMNIRLFSL